MVAPELPPRVSSGEFTRVVPQVSPSSDGQDLWRVLQIFAPSARDSSSPASLGSFSPPSHLTAQKLTSSLHKLNGQLQRCAQLIALCSLPPRGKKCHMAFRVAARSFDHNNNIASLWKLDHKTDNNPINFPPSSPASSPFEGLTLLGISHTLLVAKYSPRPSKRNPPEFRITMLCQTILSIQSHVVHGYCGNKSATFPLQLLGFNVDVLNSVQLSNHTQYKTSRGQIFTGADLEKIHKGLKENHLLYKYSSVISGYVADVSYVEAMHRLISDIKGPNAARSSRFYTVDPVLGDDGTGYYVPDGPKMAEAYKKYLFPLADMITPNRFELSVLSGVEIDQQSEDGLNQALNAINVLHERSGIQIVALTSLNLSTSPNELTCMLSHWPGVSMRKNFRDNHKYSHYDQIDNLDGAIWTITVPKINREFTGTGDLFTALLTAWLVKTEYNFKKSLENAANTIHDILQSSSTSQDDGLDDVDARELPLISSRDKILNPSYKIKAALIEVVRETDSLSENEVQASNFKSSDRLPSTS